MGDAQADRAARCAAVLPWSAALRESEDQGLLAGSAGSWWRAVTGWSCAIDVSPRVAERAWRAARQKLMEKMGTAINDADALDA
eukprot:6740091-Prymnesium_polylepis.1